MRQIEKIVSRYIDILETYITTRDEKALEPLQALSFEAIELDISPEESVMLHKDIINEKS